MDKTPSGQGGTVLWLDLMGGFAARDGVDQGISIASRKAQAVLACLALTPGRPQSRETLMALLWSDRADPQARASLRQTLSELRKALPERDPPLLVTEGDSLWLDPTAVEVDAVVLGKSIDAGTTADLAKAAELYRGDLLAGLDVRDEAFEAWLRVERARLRERVRQAIVRLLAQQTGEAAVVTARRLLSLDPLDESTHRALIRLLAEAGQRAQAIQQYETCRRLLDAELGLAPDAETEHLVARIRRGEAGGPDAAPTQHSNSGKPSIAVLPFANMSDDPEQAYFAEGITEDIITALSKIANLLVVAGSSTSAYRGKAVDLKQVSREQGVRYVLEGSVRTAGTRVRVTAQLNDAATGHHLWAERYDRELEDIFAVQDEITREVVVALDVRLSAGEQARIWSRGTKSLEAWGCVRLATDRLNQATPASIRESQHLCEKALEHDPSYALAWATLGWTHHHDGDVGIGHVSADYRTAALDSALECGYKALELDPACADAYALVGFCHLARRAFDPAVAMAEKAVEVAPNYADILATCAVVHAKAGRPERAVELIGKATRLCPIQPSYFQWVLGTAYRQMGRPDVALDAFEAALAQNPESLSLHVGLASTLGELGRRDDAAGLVSRILSLDPDFSTKTYVAGLSYRNLADMARFENGLRAAGLPE